MNRLDLWKGVKQINPIAFSNLQINNEDISRLNTKSDDQDLFQTILFECRQLYDDHNLEENLEASLAKLSEPKFVQLMKMFPNEFSMKDMENQFSKKIGFPIDEEKLFVEERYLSTGNIINDLIKLTDLRAEEAYLKLLNIDPDHFIEEEMSLLSRNISEYRSALDREAYILLKQAGELLRKGKSNDLSNISTKILDLLEQLMSFEQERLQNIRHPRAQISHQDKGLNQLWEDLVQKFQRRMEMFSKQYYQTEAKVTSQDIESWIRTAFSRQFDNNPLYLKLKENPTSFPVSNIEHYMIHVNEINRINHLETSLMEQFQQVIRSSQFLSNNGVNQLLITLQPENLGNMAIRLMEVDGEMTLKIIASSQKTKEILESNIRELRNIFSPYQITIEEDRGDIQQIEQLLDHDFSEEPDPNKQEHREKGQEQNRDFEEEFQNVLLNEKV